MLAHHTTVVSSQRCFTLLIAVVLLSLGLASGCDKSDAPAEESEASAAADDNSAEETSAARFDKSLEGDGCELLSKNLVASVLSVPEGELERSGGGKLPCSYKWEGDGKKLYAELVRTKVFDTEELAATHFAKMTKDMSSEEVAKGMEHVKEQAEKTGQLDTKNKKMAAKKIGEGLAEGGFKFKDVEDVGDEARFELKTNELSVRVDNLYFKLTAFLGPEMEIPDKISADSMKKASAQWHKETRPQRLDASTKMARAIIETL